MNLNNFGFPQNKADFQEGWKGESELHGQYGVILYKKNFIISFSVLGTQSVFEYEKSQNLIFCYEYILNI